MEEGNKGKRTMACSNDRLSNLPNKLIYYIMSFLSTEEAYRTSVLSKKWELICTNIPDLHFDLPNISDDSILYEETKSVYAALLRRNKNIRKLSLVGDLSCLPSDVHIWISKALDLNVQELYLDMTLDKTVFLPRRLSASESLVILKLKGRIQFNLNSSSNVYFPSLKILHLTKIVLNSFFVGESNSKFDLDFLSGCPRLEEFYLLDMCKQSINITLPLLKRLYLVLAMPSHMHSSEVGTIKINLLSALEILHIADSSARKYEFVNFPNVDRAILRINNHPDSYSNLYTLLKGLCNAKSLTLQPQTVKFLIQSMEDNLDNLSHITFHNLSSLSLSVEMSENYRWDMLVNFLQSAPNLKNLAIKKLLKSEDGNSDLLQGNDKNLGWKEPLLTPSCLSTSLITFEFKGIQNIKAEFNFTRYIIERSSKLKNVKISTKETGSLLETNLLKGLKTPLLDWKQVKIKDQDLVQ